MSDDNKILNKGLDALLGESQNNQKTVKEINLNKIKPGRFQPRSNFDDVKLQELTNSIKNQGVLSPILVRELGLNEFEVIAGERRLRAAKRAGLESIPCLVDQKQDQDALVSALIENLQREDLNPVEEARGLDRLKREFGLTQDEVASSTGKARSTIANSLRILSGYYGLLRPFDQILPYRLEMGTKLENENGNNLYKFWGDKITDVLNEDIDGDDIVVNLASDEYFK